MMMSSSANLSSAVSGVRRGLGREQLEVIDKHFLLDYHTSDDL
jgi:hypothetical protein